MLFSADDQVIIILTGFTIIYYIKYSALYGFRALIKLIISRVRLFMIISQVKIVAIQTITNHSFWRFYISGKSVVYIIKRKIHGCFETPDLFRVLNMISGISADPCIRETSRNLSKFVTLYNSVQ